MVRCGSREKMYEFKGKMKKEYGFEFIDATASTPLGTSMFFNLTTKLMFYCNLALNNLSGPYIGNKAIDMDDFITIVEIYRKKSEYGK